MAAAVLSACESTSPVSALVSDSTISADVASSAGDAIATALETMTQNEGLAALPGLSADVAGPFADNVFSYDRTRSCYDANNAVVAACSPLSTVRKIVTHVEIDGSRTGSRSTEGGNTVTWSGSVHRIADDTLTRNFNAAVEASRSHSGYIVGDDALTFSDGTISRVVTEATRDSIKAVTWNLPRSANPWPVSGSVVRAVAVHVVATRENETRTRDVTRLVRVVFPADAQGNVVLTINDKTCNLNLVTHRILNCQ